MLSTAGQPLAALTNHETDSPFNRQLWHRRKQKEFLSAALGGPLPWTGKDMRKAHDGMGLTEVHFNAIAENLVNTLKDLKIPQELIDQVVAVALTTKDDVLGRPKKRAEGLSWRR